MTHILHGIALWASLNDPLVLPWTNFFFMMMIREFKKFAERWPLATPGMGKSMIGHLIKHGIRHTECKNSLETNARLRDGKITVHVKCLTSHGKIGAKLNRNVFGILWI